MASLGINRVKNSTLAAAEPAAKAVLEAIHKATRRIVAADNPDEAIGFTTDWAMAHFKPSFGALAILEHRDGTAIVQAAHGRGASKLIGIAMPELYQGAADEVVFDPDLIHSPNAADRDRSARFGTRSCAAVPIVVNGNVFGSLSIVRTLPDVPKPNDLIALSVIAQLVSLKIAASPTWSRTSLSTKQERFRSVIAWIDANLERPLTQATIAARRNLSTAGCARAFQEAFGVSLHQYIIGRRIDRARKLLVTGHLSVREVAETVGFPSENWFSASFRRHIGTSPSSYMRTPEDFED